MIGSIVDKGSIQALIDNLTKLNLRELAIAAAATDLDIASGMHEIASYFIVDGDPTVPEFPLRVFL
jgi:hypothetical protein